MAGPREMLPRWLVDHHLNSILPDGDATLQPPAHMHLAPWDDGFTPSGCGGRPGKIIRDQPRDQPGLFTVLDDAVSARTADLLYASAARATVWGVYVPLTELRLPHVDAAVHVPVPGAISDEAADEDTYRHTLARHAVQEFLVNTAARHLSAADWGRVHGVAVWVIASDCDDETEYHLDYAEMIRYETNVVVPPLYGATLHVSPLRDAATSSPSPVNQQDALQPLRGGGFHTNTLGLAHYAKYGYKTRKQPQRLTTDELERRSAQERGWQHVGYAYRRGILCDGELPHFSGRVRELPAKLTPGRAHSDAVALDTEERLPVKRVVVGFNLFPVEIGACVAKFPEHSRAFNRYVKLSQAAVKQTARSQSGWSLASVRANPKQAAFLKLLARKVREKQRQEAQTPEQSAE